MVTGKAKLDSPGTDSTNDFPEFKAWALSFVKNNESLEICLPSFLYGGITWTCSTLRKRLRLISGSSISVANVAKSTTSAGTQSASSFRSERVHGRSLKSVISSPLAMDTSEPSDYFGDVTSREASSNNASRSPYAEGSEALDPPKQAMIASSKSESLRSDMINRRYPEGSSFDWTRLPMSAALPRHIQFARSIDWAATPLGPIENWSFDLRAMCNLIMGSPHPAAMYWGDEYIAVYNEAYILLAGQKHPALMVRLAYGDKWSRTDALQN